MARLGVRSGSVAFASFDGSPANSVLERTGANERERSRAFAMQKVVGSSPIIRSSRGPANRAFSSWGYAGAVRRRDLAVGVRKTRSSRRLVLVVIIVLVVVLPVIWLALQTLGGQSPKHGAATAAIGKS
jgi:hypothetical protein